MLIIESKDLMYPLLWHTKNVVLGYYNPEFKTLLPGDDSRLYEQEFKVVKKGLGHEYVIEKHYNDYCVLYVLNL